MGRGANRSWAAGPGSGPTSRDRRNRSRDGTSIVTRYRQNRRTEADRRCPGVTQCIGKISHAWGKSRVTSVAAQAIPTCFLRHRPCFFRLTAWLRRAVVAVGHRWQLRRGPACCVGGAADHVIGSVGAMHPGPLNQPPLASDASRLRSRRRRSLRRISTPLGFFRDSRLRHAASEWPASPAPRKHLAPRTQHSAPKAST